MLGSYVNEANAPDLIDTTEADGIGQVYLDEDGHTVALDDESFGGYAVRGRLRWDSRYVNVITDYHDFSPTFRTDNGFTTRNSYRQGSVNVGVSFNPDRQWLSEWSAGTDVSRIWDYTGRFRDEWVRPWVYLMSKGQTALEVSHLESRERYRGVLINGIRRTGIEISTRASAAINGGFEIEFGKSIYRSIPVLANSFQFDAYLHVNPTQRLIITPQIEYFKMEDRHDGSTFFEGHIWRTRLDYQFTRRLFVRLIMEYDNFDDYFVFEPLLTYRINPFTVFYLGSGAGYEHYDKDDYTGLSDSQWKMSERHFFAKFQYLFRV